MTQEKTTGQFVARTWVQGLAGAVLIAAWPILSTLATAQTWEGIDWAVVANGLRYSCATAAMTYVWRTVLDPRAEARAAKRVAGHLTEPPADGDEGS